MKNLLIIGLVTVNLFMGWALYQSADTPPEARPPKSHATSSIDQSGFVSESGFEEPDQQLMTSPLTGDESLASLTDSLRSANLQEDLIRQIVLASITRDQSSLHQRSQNEPYWLKAERNQKMDKQYQLDAEAEQRILLIDLFGSEIIDDSNFEHLFKPMNDSLSFLSSDKQIAIHELVQMQMAEAADLQREGRTRETWDEIRASALAVQEAIAQGLSPDEFFEYQLRESRLASRMRQGMDGFDYSEQEFRDLFELREVSSNLRSLGEMTDRKSLMESRQEEERQIREYLGEERYGDYSRSQDPTYQQLASLGERFGTSDADLVEVYELTSDYQARLRELFRDRSLDGEARRQQISSLQSSLHDSVEEIAGDNLAESVRQNFSRPRPPGRRGPP